MSAIIRCLSLLLSSLALGACDSGPSEEQAGYEEMRGARAARELAQAREEGREEARTEMREAIDEARADADYDSQQETLDDLEADLGEPR